MRTYRMLLFAALSLTVAACNDDDVENPILEQRGCITTQQRIADRHLDGTFFPCRTDGLLREHPASVHTQWLGDSLVVTLTVPSLSFDTIMRYAGECAYYPREPNEKFHWKMQDVHGHEAEYNLYFDQLAMSFTYEQGCPYGVFTTPRQ